MRKAESWSSTLLALRAWGQTWTLHSHPVLLVNYAWLNFLNVTIYPRLFIVQGKAPMP